MTSTTWSAGTTTTTRSTGSPIAARLRCAGSAGHGVGLRVHDVQPAGEAARADRLEHGRAQPAGRAAYADHGDALGVQQRAQRARLGAPLAAIRGVEGGGGHLGAQLDRHLAVLAAARHREARSPEDAQHPVVVREHLGLESGDPVLAAQRREVLEQQAAEPPAPVLVGHQEGDLRAFVRQQLGGRQRCDAAADHGNQRDRLVVGLVEQVARRRPVRRPGSA